MKLAFEKIIGNEEIKKIFEKKIKNDNLSHSYMFVGVEGIGKLLFAKEISKLVMCLNENKYCNKCKSCIQLESGNNPDFTLIQPEGNSIKIEQIRNLNSKVLEKPIVSNKKIYIINDSEKMTVEAQNCLLKTLEEPPEYVVIILITSNESLMLNTIKSRCTKIMFKQIEDNLLEEYLKKNLEIEHITEGMKKAFNGSIGRAIQLKDKIGIYKEVEKIIKNIGSINKVQILNSEVFYDKENIIDILDYISNIMYDCAKGNIQDSMKYINSINIIEDTKNRLKANCNFDMTIDNCLLSIWEEF